MPSKLATFALFAVLALTGCATPQPSATTESVSDREYQTGSNIPRRRAPPSEAQGARDREALERARDQAPATPRPGVPGALPGG